MTAMEAVSPRRPHLTLLVLLGMVLTVTLQLVSGLMLALGQYWVLPWHIVDGQVTAGFLLAEWAWLLFSPSGRTHFRRIFLLSASYRRNLLEHLRGKGGTPLREGLNGALEGVFMLAASAAVAFGLALWQGCAACLDWHRALAVTLAVLWIAHSLLSACDHWPRKR